MENKEAMMNWELTENTLLLKTAGTTLNCPLDGVLAAAVYSRSEKRLRHTGKFRFRTLDVSGDDRLALEAVCDQFDLTVTLDFQFTAAGFTLRIDPFMLIERREATFRLMELSVLPGLLNVSAGEDAQWILPAYTGARVEPGTLGGRLRSRSRFYMEQEQWEKFGTLNAFAISTERGSVLGIVREGDFFAWCDSEVSDGSARTFVTFGVRHTPADNPPERGLCAAYRVRPGNMRWQDWAFEYRRYLIEECGIVPLAERVKRNPVLAYAADAMRLKIFMATKTPSVPDGSSPVKICTTFEQAEQILDELKSRGIDKAIVTLVGWNIDGHDGAYPTRFPADPRLGGEEGLKKLIAKARALDYQIVVHDNVTDAYLRSPEMDYDMLSGDEFGERQISGIWAGGESYKMCPVTYLQRYGAILKRIHDLGFAGCAYLDAQTTGLFRCSDPAHPADERGFALALCRILESVRRLYGAVSCEGGAAYVLPYADEIAHLHDQGTFAHYRNELEPDFVAMVKEIVPFYNLAVHGLVLYRKGWSPANGNFQTLLTMGDDWYELEFVSGGLGTDYRLALESLTECAALRRALPSRQLTLVRDYREDGDRLTVEFENGVVYAIDRASRTAEIRRDGKTVLRVAAPDRKK